jgi:hypothetical protein
VLPSADKSQVQALDASKSGERLVSIGFRCWLANYEIREIDETHDIDCWEMGWNLYVRELGTKAAKEAVTKLTCWVRAVHITACRRISTYPFGCKGFCPDECMAISMIAASQHSACPAIRACAFALLGTSDVGGVVETAASFGAVIRDSGHLLPQDAICDASILATLDTSGQKHSKH